MTDTSRRERRDASFSRTGRLATLATSAVIVLVTAWCFPRPGRGQDAGKVAANTDLLHAIPFDRVTLNDNTVLVVEPVSPRPLPAFDSEKDLKRKRAYRPPEEGNVAVKGKKSNVVMPREEEKAEELASQVTLHLLQTQGEQRDFRVKRGHIKDVEYFEDMLLAEGDRWLLARNYARAFECYLRVQTREPGWKGVDERVNRLLFEEGSTALLDGDGERGLRLLRELFVRQPSYPGLADKLAKAYGARALRAFELGLYAKGRKILHDLEPLAPGHPVIAEVRDKFIARARQLAEEGARQTGAARLDALVDSLRVWPELEGTGERYAEAFAAVPTLDVAVTDIPRPVGPWIRSPADRRVTPLLYLSVLARDDDEALEGKRAGQLAAGLESSDLGRRLTLKLRETVTWSDRSRPVSAIDVARSFTDRTEPASPQYDARWADSLDRVETTEDGRIEIRLNRAFLKPAFWLLAPVGPAHGGWDGRVATVDRGRELVADGLFRWTSASANELQLTAAEGSGSSPTPKVRRIRETRYPDAASTVGALIRGEVSLVEHVAPDRLAALAGQPEIKIGRHSSPALHRIALDGRNPALRNRAFRRALSYAIDRRTLLEETVLKRPANEENRISDGPFAAGSSADAPAVAPLGYDPLLSKMLVAAAKKELETGAVKLTFEYPAIPEAQAIVPKLVDAFRLIGVETVPIERPESELEAELRAGRKFDLAYRASSCDEPALEAGPFLCPGYDAPGVAGALASVASPRILQLLLQLDRASEWPTARGLVVQIDRESRDELPVLPLWQLQDHYAWRTRLKGPAEVAERLYEGIETWEIGPWYARDAF